jgi:hypothetical protein
MMLLLAMVLWLHLSGGLAGEKSEVRVEDGVVHVRGKQSCDVELSDPDRSRLAAALRKIHPGGWKEKYVDPSCRDCRTTTLQVGDRTVTWDDASADKVPPDARSVATAMEPLLTCQ